MGDLTDKFIKSAKPGRHGDGGGLYLLVKPSGARSWVLRVQVDGRRRDIGLGGYREVKIGQRSAIGDDVPLEQRGQITLSEVRELAVRLRNVAKSGRDPAAERRRDRKPPPSFKDAAIAAHKALAPTWSDKTGDAFLASLQEHAFPSLGRKRVDEVDADDIATTLKAIWTTKPGMGRKVRQRIGKAGEGKNFPAMPYDEVSQFFGDLGQATETKGRLALMLVIATAARSGEVREARWKPIDFAKREWNRPAELMGKTGKAHTVTLNNVAIAVLQRAAACSNNADPNALIFANRDGGVLSDMTISKVMRDAKLP